MRASRAVYWRCFHCCATFTREQNEEALAHFGADEGERPVCRMRVPGEYYILNALRDAQEELARYRAEDSDLMRALYSQDLDHRVALVRAEERGYKAGVLDMSKPEKA